MNVAFHTSCCLARRGIPKLDAKHSDHRPFSLMHVHTTTHAQILRRIYCHNAAYNTSDRPFAYADIQLSSAENENKEEEEKETR